MGRYARPCCSAQSAAPAALVKPPPKQSFGVHHFDATSKVFTETESGVKMLINITIGTLQSPARPSGWASGCCSKSMKGGRNGFRCGADGRSVGRSGIVGCLRQSRIYRLARGRFRRTAQRIGAPRASRRAIICAGGARARCALAAERCAASRFQPRVHSEHRGGG